MTSCRPVPSRHASGFVLIWVLVLGVFLAALTAFAISSVRNRAVSTQISSAESHNQLLVGNASSYSQRLLTVHASELAAAVPRNTTASPATWPLVVGSRFGTSTPPTAGQVAHALQEKADGLFCNRPAVAGTTVRIAFSALSCGQSVNAPAEPTVTPTSQGGSAVIAPYQIITTAPQGSQAVTQGVLKLVTGTVPVSAYALYLGGDSALSSDVAVSGPSYVLGLATLDGTFTTSTLETAGCSIPVAGCSGQGGLRFANGSYQTPMQLIPSAAHPCQATGCVTGDVNPAALADAPVSQGAAASVMPSFNRVLLGIGNSGEQRVTLCQDTVCSTYVQVGRVLFNDNHTPITSTFDGVYQTGGNVVVEPEISGSPSVSDVLTVQSGGSMTVSGDLRLVNSPCPQGSDCTVDDGMPSNLLGLIANGDIALNASAVDASLYSGGAVLGTHQGEVGATLILGSVASAQRSSNVTVTHDPRLAAPTLTRPAGFPTLSATTHLITVTDGR